MDESSNWIRSGDGTRIFLRRWSPGENPLGVLHIIHGMAEHSGRYRRVAESLCKHGFEVWAADQRGHGKTADPSMNNPGAGGLLGHCADRDGFTAVSADIDLINRHIAESSPALPLFLMGHSWGSFIAQAYIEKYTFPLAGCILSGTRGPGGRRIKWGSILVSILARIIGVRKPSALVYNMVDGPYNRPFRPNRTPFDWLSRDAGEVDAYAADPLCGMRCSAGFYRDMLRGLKDIHREGAMAEISRNLPVYIFCGAADPVGDMGASPTKLVEAYRTLGIRDLEFVLYPDARHEALNETNRDEVTANLVSWIKRHLPPKPEM